MTCREKLKMEHPEFVDEHFYGGCYRCPTHYGYLPKPTIGCGLISCEKCWDREIPDTEEKK